MDKDPHQALYELYDELVAKRKEVEREREGINWNIREDIRAVERVVSLLDEKEDRDEGT